MTSSSYKEFYQQSIDQPDAFWREQATLIDWHKPFEQTCDFSRPKSDRSHVVL